MCERVNEYIGEEDQEIEHYPVRYVNGRIYQVVTDHIDATHRVVEGKGRYRHPPVTKK